jgi:hypothetical protein
VLSISELAARLKYLSKRIKRKMNSKTKSLTVSEIIALGESGVVLTQSQIGVVLQVSPATMSRLVALKEIPFVVIQSGRRKKTVRFRWRDVERWLALRSRGPSRSNQRIRMVDSVVAQSKNPSKQSISLKGDRSEQPVDAHE